jgi:hypothetical protein
VCFCWFMRLGVDVVKVCFFQLKFGVIVLELCILWFVNVVSML